MHQNPTLPHQLFTKPIFFFLVVVILLVLSGGGLQAAPPEPQESPRETNRLSGSRAAGAKWAGPWKEGGPVVMDTTPPPTQVVPPPTLSSPQSPDADMGIVLQPSYEADYLDRYCFTPYWLGIPPRKPFPYYRFRPQTLHRFPRFDIGKFRKGFRAFQGPISSNRVIWGGHSGIHGRSFRGGGFRGGGFRGR